MTTDAPDYGAAYRELREALCAFVSGLTPAQRDQSLPACSDWTAWHVLAHVAGIPADVLVGKLDVVGTDAWTQAHIDARIGKSVAEIVAEWATTGAQMETLAAGAPPAMAIALIGDLCTHDFDVRGAFGDTATRASAGAGITFDYYASTLGQRLTPLGLALTVSTDEGDTVQVGAEGGAAATVTTSRFELTRALTGRRSADQIRAFAWTGDAAPYVEVFAMYPMRATALVE